MTRPFEGIRVIDLCTFLAGPFASSLLADFGAHVVKVETPSGDPYRVYMAEVPGFIPRLRGGRSAHAQ